MGRSGTGSAGSSFDADNGDFPGVPYTMADFNGCDTCPECCCIQVYTRIFVVKLRYNNTIEIPI